MAGGTVKYEYDSKSNLALINDEVISVNTSYIYDLANRLIEAKSTNGFSLKYEYDKNSNISKVTNHLKNDNISNTTNYNFDLDNKITKIELGNNKNIIYSYDKLSRLNNQKIQNSTGEYGTTYEYIDNESNSLKTTTMIKSMKNGLNENDKLTYTYDNIGNIETITKASEQKQKYYYDAINQLTRENNKDINKTIVYNYDTGGNILNKIDYNYTEEQDLTTKTPVNTIEYTYENTNWKDQLTSYNGQAITYDEIGNPTSYNNNTYTWQNGRQLKSITNNTNNLSVSYKYNESGIRTEKTVNSVTTNYYLEGSKVIYEKTGNNVIYYTYDDQGQVIGLKYNDTQYYYIKNAQGDIIGILDNNLNKVVEYTYDSWGNPIEIKDNQGNTITDPTNIGLINPYRYRGYRYDTETGLYYLQSRYYNPEWGRFINADAVVNTNDEILGTNLYAYCGNNPVNRVDETGYGWISAIVKNVVNYVVNTIKTVVNTVSNVVKAVNTVVNAVNSYNNWREQQKQNSITKSAANQATIMTKLNPNANYEQEYERAYKVADSTYDMSYVASIDFVRATAIAGQITGYTRHGINQAIFHDGVGVKPSAILDAVRNPIEIFTQTGGRTKFIGNQAVVVLNAVGEVITTWALGSNFWR